MDLSQRLPFSFRHAQIKQVLMWIAVYANLIPMPPQSQFFYVTPKLGVRLAYHYISDYSCCVVGNRERCCIWSLLCSTHTRSNTMHSLHWFVRSCKTVCLHHTVDVTARRNTIANALELVKVTKGRVNFNTQVKLCLTCCCIVCLLCQNIIVSSQAEKV